MADFESALKVVFIHEGGFVNDPDDPGGATNMGITASTLAAYLKQPISISQVQNLSPDVAARILRQNYWNQMNLDCLDQRVALALFDLGVLIGTPTIVQMAQEILGITQDRILGSHTVASIQKYVHAEWLALKIIEAVQSHMVERCVANPKKLKFLSNWINRTHDIIDFVYEHSNS